MNIEISPKEYEKKMDYDSAVLYCNLLDIDGKNDWRLPDIDELGMIYRNNRTWRNNIYLFEKGGEYWSSTIRKQNNNMIYNCSYVFSEIEHFGGYVQVCENHYDFIYIRPVRDI